MDKSSYKKFRPFQLFLFSYQQFLHLFLIHKTSFRIFIKMSTNSDSIGFRSKNRSNWIPLNQREKIHPFWIFCICANQITINFIWIPIGVLTKPICAKLDLSNFATTLVMLIGSLMGFFVPPIIASLSDYTTLKFGRRRIYLIIGEAFVLLGLFFIGFCRDITSHFNPLVHFITTSPDDLNRTASILYFVIGQVFAFLGANMINGPGRAMCSDVVPKSQQVYVSNICVFDGAIAGLISNSIGAFDLSRYFHLPNETIVITISCIIGLIALVVSVISTPEEPLIQKPEKKHNPFHKMIKSVKQMDVTFNSIFLATFLYSLGSMEFSVHSADCIARNVFHGDPKQSIELYDEGIAFAQFLNLFTTVAQLLYSPCNTRVIKKVGFRLTWIFGTACLCISDLLFYLTENTFLLIVVYILMGIGGVVMCSLPYAYVSIISPADKLAENITMIILSGNIAGFVAQIFLTMYLGSFPVFMEDASRLIGISTVFAILSLIIGSKGFSDKTVKKA